MAEETKQHVFTSIYKLYNTCFSLEGDGVMLMILDKHEANDDNLDLTDCAEFVQSNPELRVVSSST